MMSVNFSFQTAREILFGQGKINSIGEIGQGLGKRALLVTGTHGYYHEEISRSLAEKGCSSIQMQVGGEPDLDLIAAGLQAYKTNQCDFVIACGGGSVLDSGKAIAALAMNPGEILDYLEVVGKGQPLTREPAGFVAIPTTAGTGSEVTKNAVIAVPDQRVKVSLRSPKMYPAVALVDPALTLNLPADVTARTGMDALTQLIEPYLSIRSNPMADLYCREGIRLAARSLLQAFRNGSDMAAREDMSYASLLGGIALANAGLGAVHGFAGPIGGMFSAPHGAVCAALLPHVFQANFEAVAGRQPDDPVLGRMREIAILLTGSASARVTDGVNWLYELCRELQIPGLRAYGIGSQDFPAIIAKSTKAGSMKTNPVALTEDELAQVLNAAL